MSGSAAAGKGLSIGQAETEQVVKLGLKLFHELGARTRTMEEEVQAYRDAMVKLAQREGVEVPSFTAEDGAFDAEKMCEWLGGVLAGPLAAEEKSRAGGSKGRSGGGGRALGTRGKKTRGGEGEQKKRKWQDVIDEPDEKKAWSMVREFEPRAYMVNYPALEKAMSRTKRAKPLSAERERPAGKFRVEPVKEEEEDEEWAEALREANGLMGRERDRNVLSWR